MEDVPEKHHPGLAFLLQGAPTITPPFPNDPRLHTSRFLAISNKYGHLFAITREAAVVHSPTCNLHGKQHSSEFASVSVKCVDIGISSDESTLAICTTSRVLIFDVPTLIGGTSVHTTIDASKFLLDNEKISHMCWSNSKSTLFVVLLESGTILCCDLQIMGLSGSPRFTPLIEKVASAGNILSVALCGRRQKGRIFRVSPITRISGTPGVTSLLPSSLCWGNNGELIVGTTQGQIVVHKVVSSSQTERLAIIEVPKWESYDSEQTYSIYSIHFVGNWPGNKHDLLLAGYKSSDGSPAQIVCFQLQKQTHLVASSYAKFPVCADPEALRLPFLHVVSIPQWRVLVLLSSTTGITSVMGLGEADELYEWAILDDKRPDLPLHKVTGSDTFPQGACIDFTRRTEDGALSAPLLYILSSEGILFVYSIVNPKAYSTIPPVMVTPVPKIATHSTIGDSAKIMFPKSTGEPLQPNLAFGPFSPLGPSAPKSPTISNTATFPVFPAHQSSAIPTVPVAKANMNAPSPIQNNSKPNVNLTQASLQQRTIPVPQGTPQLAHPPLPQAAQRHQQSAAPTTPSPPPVADVKLRLMREVNQFRLEVTEAKAKKPLLWHPTCTKLSSIVDSLVQAAKLRAEGVHHTQKLNDSFTTLRTKYVSSIAPLEDAKARSAARKLPSDTDAENGPLDPASIALQIKIRTDVGKFEASLTDLLEHLEASQSLAPSRDASLRIQTTSSFSSVIDIYKTINAHHTIAARQAILVDDLSQLFHELQVSRKNSKNRSRTTPSTPASPFINSPASPYLSSTRFPTTPQKMSTPLRPDAKEREYGTPTYHASPLRRRNTPRQGFSPLVHTPGGAHAPVTPTPHKNTFLSASIEEQHIQMLAKMQQVRDVMSRRVNSYGIVVTTFKNIAPAPSPVPTLAPTPVSSAGIASPHSSTTFPTLTSNQQAHKPATPSFSSQNPPFGLPAVSSFPSLSTMPSTVPPAFSKPYVPPTLVPSFPATQPNPLKGSTHIPKDPSTSSLRSTHSAISSLSKEYEDESAEEDESEDEEDEGEEDEDEYVDEEEGTEDEHGKVPVESKVASDKKTLSGSQPTGLNAFGTQSLAFSSPSIFGTSPFPTNSSPAKFNLGTSAPGLPSPSLPNSTFKFAPNLGSPVANLTTPDSSTLPVPTSATHAQPLSFGVPTTSAESPLTNANTPTNTSTTHTTAANAPTSTAPIPVSPAITIDNPVTPVTPATPATAASTDTTSSILATTSSSPATTSPATPTPTPAPTTAAVPPTPITVPPTVPPAPAAVPATPASTPPTPTAVPTSTPPTLMAVPTTAPATTISSATPTTVAASSIPPSTPTLADPLSSFSLSSLSTPDSAPTAPTFGQPTSSTSIFGQSSNQTSAFGQSVFGQAAKPNSIFGQASQPTTPTPGFGTSAFGGQKSIFGQNTSTSTFGQVGFGTPAQSTAVFGQPAPAATTPSPATSVFGQASLPSATAAPSQSGPVFGQTQPVVPASTFGAPSQPASVFGQTAKPAASAFGGSVFGTTGSAFSGTSFGTPSQPGSTTSAFGSSVFGQASQPGSSSVFGQASQPGSSSVFGQTSQPSTFGQASVFGQPAKPATSVFGQAGSQPTSFGQVAQQATSAFGQSSPSVFGQSSTAFGGQKSVFGASGSVFGGAPSQSFASNAPATRTDELKKTTSDPSMWEMRK